MVDFVALLQAAQDRDRIFGGRLADEDRLETAFERSVFPMCLRYSSSVVAPTPCNSPRAVPASAGRGVHRALARRRRRVCAARR
jgi:hypothetical protein